MNIELAKACASHGHKVRHTYFMHDEWVSVKNGKLYTESNQEIDPEEFWSIRIKDEEKFKEGWRVVQDIDSPKHDGTITINKVAFDVYVAKTNTTHPFKSELTMRGDSFDNALFKLMAFLGEDRTPLMLSDKEKTKIYIFK